MQTRTCLTLHFNLHSLDKEKEPWLGVAWWNVKWTGTAFFFNLQLHDTDSLVAVTGLEHIRAEKSQLSCTVCKQTKGAVVQCSFGNCRVAFHPLCARMAGYHMPIRDGAGGKAIVKQYCRQHGSVMRSQGDAAPPKAPLKPKEDPSPKAAPKAKAKAKEPSKETAKRELEAKQASFAALRYMRRELEHLRLMCDRVVKREKVKKDLLKAEHECWRKRLESPALAMATEASMPPAPLAPAGPAQPTRGKGGADGKMIANLIQVQFGPANDWPFGATLSLVAMVTVGIVAFGYVVLLRFLGSRIR